MDRLTTRILSAVLLAVPLLHAAGTITVSPANESTPLGGQRQYSALVSGLANTAVTWTVVGGGTGSYGSIDMNGLYTAPSTMPPNGQTFTVTATSVMDGTVKGSASGNLKLPAPKLTGITPASSPSFTNFTLTCVGSGFQSGAMIWVSGVQYPTKFISATQLSAAVAFYTTGTMVVTVVNPGSTFSTAFPLTITGQGSGGGSTGTLTVTPKTASVVQSSTQQSSTQQFTATLNGATQTATWSTTAGSITAAGLYTAPAVLPNPATATITATASGQTATATVTILSNVPPAITSVGSGVIPTGVFSVTVTGTGFTAAAQATLGGSPLATQYVSPTTLSISGFASQSGTPNLIVANASIASAPFPVQVGVANPLVSASAARRFLQQAAFGPTPTDAAHVQQVGFQGWLNEQFAMPQVANYQAFMNSSQGGLSQHFLTNAVMQPDQLRQKVAFALSQILVISINKAIWNQIVIPYQEMLMADAFTNYRKILGDVTLSPAMGQFLDMANNGKANTAGTVLPNENYAREVLQLFSIGTWKLNVDGTQMLDATNSRIPTYDQKTISEFARVFTGWTYQPVTAGGPVIWGAYINPVGTLQPYPAQHDSGGKTLLNGAPNAAGLTIQADLNAALDNIFTHQNVGPFISKQLIQHLVMSNPSPAYVQRVAQVFNNPANRGDMKAVITAILLDQEARQNDNGMTQLSKDGHLQEPALFLPGLVRAFGGLMNDQNYFTWELTNMSQEIYNAPSVFNYYSPGYTIPQSGGVLGPEFQIYTPYTSIYRDNLVASLFGSYSNPVITYGPGTTIDLTPFMALANSPATLVDALDFTLTCGTMPAAMKQIMVQAVTAEAGGSLKRIETGAYLILASGYYNVWH